MVVSHGVETRTSRTGSDQSSQLNNVPPMRRTNNQVASQTSRCAKARTTRDFTLPAPPRCIAFIMDKADSRRSRARATTRHPASAHLRLLAFAIALLPANAAWSDDATLQQGLHALKAGNASKAVELFSAELAAAGRTPEQRAKAFYLRAKAHYAAKQPALAMNDAAAALWFNKLSAADAADAATIRGQALAEAMTSAARVPAQTPAMPAFEKAPPRIAAPAAPAAAATKPVTAVAEPQPQAEPRQRTQPVASAPPPRPFTATTVQQPEAPVVVTTVAPPQAPTPTPEDAPGPSAPGPSAPDWAQAKVKRETIATVPVPPEQLPARARPTPQAPSPRQPIVTGSIGKTDAAPAGEQTSTTDVLPWQTPPARTASVTRDSVEATADAPVTPPPFQTQTTSNIVTGSIARHEPAPQLAPPKSPTPAPPTAAVQPSRPATTVADAMPPEEQTATTAPAAASSSLSVQGLATMFSSDNPMASDVARADELQRARYERIRQLNASRGQPSQ